MAMRLDFTNQDYFRDSAARLEALRAAGPVVEVKFPIVGKVWVTTTYEAAGRVLKDNQTFTLRKDGGVVAGFRWWMPRIVGTLVNKHAHHGRAGPHAVAWHCRRSLPPPRHSRHGAAHPRHRRSTRRRPIRRRKPGRSRRSLCAQAAACGHLRIARPAANRQGEIHDLGQHRWTDPRPVLFLAGAAGVWLDEALSGGALADRARAWWRGADRRACPGGEGGWADQRRGDGGPWSFSCSAQAPKPPRI